MRTPPALLAVCMLCLSIGTGSLAAQETKAEEPTRLEKLLSGEPPETIQDLKAMQERFRSLATKLVPCTVGLRVGGAQGSGVIISEDGYVLTAGHVSGQAGRTVTVILQTASSSREKPSAVTSSWMQGSSRLRTKVSGPTRRWENQKILAAASGASPSAIPAATDRKEARLSG